MRMKKKKNFSKYQTKRVSDRYIANKASTVKRRIFYKRRRIYRNLLHYRFNFTNKVSKKYDLKKIIFIYLYIYYQMNFFFKNLNVRSISSSYFLQNYNESSFLKVSLYKKLVNNGIFRKNSDCLYPDYSFSKHNVYTHILNYAQNNSYTHSSCLVDNAVISKTTKYASI